ncbi:MAG: glycosyltransferase [Acidobacteria bacterium]|nr:glycosyltransferase [Acidobacteriota bacterium]MBV9624626.1 glycosyltransferase [Acidobacteriota bacterium]
MTPLTTDNPLVSIIVPARNEEISLRSCLESLVTQEDVDFEILVVDDGSSDGTAAIAGSFSGVRIIDAGSLPAGWTGKNNAVAQAAKVAGGEWLLFTDADTVHKPGSLARAIDEAEGHDAALLSYSPEQEVRGFWEKALMPLIFADLVTTYPPQKVSDWMFPVAAANGQYLLMRRETYEAVGGHARVAGDLLEDVALARLVKSSGRRIFFRYGADAVRTRMYRSFSELREGWTKNLALLFPHPRALAAYRALEFLLIAGSAGAVLVSAAFRRSATGAASALLLLSAGTNYWRRIRRAHFPLSASLLSVLGLPVFSYLLFRSRFVHEKHEVLWKGRVYGSPASPSASQVRTSGSS